MTTVKCIIPFYSGNGGFKRASFKDNREEYLRKTIESIDNLSILINVVIYTCTKEDTVTAKKYGKVIQIDCNPKDLIYEMCKKEQGNIKEDSVLYTDSDHVFINNILPVPSYPYYIVPHRLEEVGTPRSKKRGALYEYNDKSYVIINHSGAGVVNCSRNMNLFYSGCYICSTRLFNEIIFSNTIPEDPAGFNIFDLPQSICLKMEDFFVEHLSGKDYNEKY